MSFASGKLFANMAENCEKLVAARLEALFEKLEIKEKERKLWVMANQEFAKKVPKSTKTAKPKDPNRPKGASSAWILFTKDVNAILKGDEPSKMYPKDVSRPKKKKSGSNTILVFEDQEFTSAKSKGLASYIWKSVFKPEHKELYDKEYKKQKKLTDKEQKEYDESKEAKDGKSEDSAEEEEEEEKPKPKSKKSKKAKSSKKAKESEDEDENSSEDSD